MNLSVNARDAMPRGGNLTIRTRSINGQSNEEIVIIDVIDSGSGIERGLIDKIFDPFYTTKGMEGTGLGLSVVLGIMQQHDGWVDVVSEAGEGTTFTLGMKALTHQAADVIREGDLSVEEKKDTRGKGHRILLIEDEPAVIQFVSRALECHGYQIVLATTKTMAIEIYTAEKGQFDMVFTDAKLPDGNGIEVLEHIHRLNPSMPALLSSGYTDDRALVDQAKERGVEFLQKPYPLELLYQTVHEILDGGQFGKSSPKSNLVALVG
jgi:two-component system, cell cycle sensor histidine kinase and response regulator CckA